jgi:hypothetical protein
MPTVFIAQVAAAIPKREGGAGGPAKPGAHPHGEAGAERRADQHERHEKGQDGRQWKTHRFSIVGTIILCGLRDVDKKRWLFVECGALRSAPCWRACSGNACVSRKTQLCCFE